MTTVQSTTTAPAFMLLMLVAGIGIPVMATLNAGLGQRLASPVAASVILFAVGLLLSATVMAVVGTPPVARFAAVPPVYYIGAIFMTFYVLSITIAAPRIGIGNAVFFVLLGQVIAATTIDHFGLWGAIVSPVTGRRLIGIVVMALGLYLARKAT